MTKGPVVGARNRTPSTTPRGFKNERKPLTNKDGGIQAQFGKSQVFVYPPNSLPKEDTSQKPDEQVSLSYVASYNGRGLQKHNLKSLGQHILFPSATVLIKMNITNHQQIFFEGHTDEITALGVNEAGTVACTGQKAQKDAFFIVWDIAN